MNPGRGLSRVDSRRFRRN